MAHQYFAKVVNMQPVDVAKANDNAQAEALRKQNYEPCSRALYESVLRNKKNIPSA
ncbi:MAG: hypothetical protein AAFV98_17675 [Chloroflexota bacterium]